MNYYFLDMLHENGVDKIILLIIEKSWQNNIPGWLIKKIIYNDMWGGFRVGDFIAEESNIGPYITNDFAYSEEGMIKYYTKVFITRIME